MKYFFVLSKKKSFKIVFKRCLLYNASQEIRNISLGSLCYHGRSHEECQGIGYRQQRHSHQSKVKNVYYSSLRPLHIMAAKLLALNTP